MNWLSPPAFIRPRSPTYAGGYIVIDSDDGFAGDFTHWRPILQRLARKHDQWTNTRAAIMCPAVNTINIGEATYLTVAQLQQMHAEGHEVASHGRTHTGLGSHPLDSPATAGATTISVVGCQYLGPTSGYTHRITEGATTEDVTVTAIDGTTGPNNPGDVTLAAPLVNSFTTAARLQITPESADTVLQGCIDDLAAWGIPCEHHVFTYHTGSYHNESEQAKVWVGERFLSGRGSLGVMYPGDTIDTRALPSRLNGDWTLAQIDTNLDALAAGNGVLIWYGHGETDATRLGLLERLVDGALARGIRIGTRAGALERIAAF